MGGRFYVAALLSLLMLVGLTLPGVGAPEVTTVRFSAAGDFGTGPAAVATFAGIGALNNDLHLALGDLKYSSSGNEQSWCNLVKQGVGEGYPFQLVSGNHESNGPDGNINDFSACLPNQLPGAVGTYGREYYVDVPKAAPLVRFIMISPNLSFPEGVTNYNAGSASYNWTSSAIDGARTANIPWVVVGMHKPCLAVTARPCEPGPDVMNLMLSKRVDVVLTGHEHSYQRTKQLRHGPGCSAVVPGSFNAACVADSDSALTKGAGTVFATVGTGGVPLSNITAGDAEAGYFTASSGANQNPTFGVLDMSATADSLQASFARTSGGTFADTFSITAGVQQPTPPTAAFTSSCVRLVCTFDGSGSADSDGTVASYAWEFGDGSTGTGQNPSHTFAAAGTFPVTLTVTDDDGLTGSVVHDVSPSAANQAPVARFTASCTALACSFDGTGSTDGDGNVASYAWDFGDGASGSGATTSHSYAVAGTYSVELTVRDNDGATDPQTSSVTVTAPPTGVTYAVDDFSRTVQNGLGAAQVGGPWTLSNAAASTYAVSSGLARFTMSGGSGPFATLEQVSTDDVDVRLTLGTDKPASGSGLQLSAIGRKVGGNQYRTKVTVEPSGAVRLSWYRITGSSVVALTQESLVAGLNYAVGDRLAVRLRVTGTSPTVLQSRVWEVGTPEPTVWQAQATDSTAVLQAAGPIGLFFYLSRSATNAPIVVTVDDLLATSP